MPLSTPFPLFFARVCALATQQQQGRALVEAAGFCRGLCYHVWTSDLVRCVGLCHPCAFQSVVVVPAHLIASQCINKRTDPYHDSVSISGCLHCAFAKGTSHALVDE